MIYEYAPKKSKSEWIAWGAQVLTAGAVIVAIAGLFIGYIQFQQQQQSDNLKTQGQEKAAQLQALDQQRQTTLDTYLDRIQDMMLHDNFSNNPDAKSIAAARTFTVLRYLDGNRKAYLIRFLYDVYLIGYLDANGILQPHIIDVYGLDLSGAVFATITQERPDLKGVNLSHDNLYGANLKDVDLNYADLSSTYLDGADLSGADLNGAQLKGARYNTKTIQKQDIQGNLLMLQPTMWPQGFDPKKVGAICDDC